MIRAICRAFKLSVVSWGRTPKRNEEKGGKPNSWHLDFMAVDVVPDDPGVIQACGDTCLKFGLDFVNEGDHWHIEPAGARRSPPAG